MSSTINLDSATRANLLSLTNTQTLINRTQNRLATGLKVNSPLDDALAFFKARDLNARASDLSTIKSGIAGAISVITAATQGLSSIESTLQQMKALANSAIASPESSTRASLASQFNELRSQVDNLAEDASFNGVNLLKNGIGAFRPGADYLTVTFNERTDPKGINQLVVSGLKSTDFNSILATSAKVTGVAGTTTVWGQTGTAAIFAINASISAIDSALTTVRNVSSTFGTNAALLNIREDFTTNLVNTLQGGASDLVNADLNTESANLLSLQTRQQLGTISLSIAQKSQQSVLRLF
ncbi:MAG: flagellin [Rhodospirillaceae bacterium]|nr:MAG: flagellin [Rhodospirillaceae bacterium]